MKILLISGVAPVPAPLRDLIARGSTAITEAQAGGAAMPIPRGGADRLVFWAAGGDASVREQARHHASADPDSRSDALVYVSTEGAEPPEGFEAHELFVWPKDEDRLKMAFMTSA